MRSSHHDRALSLGAIGIVFGDIGTSPLYTMQECFGSHGVAPTPANILGVTSLICWSLTLVVTVKYVWVLMRLHNRGEGGVLALAALLPEARSARAPAPTALIVLALLGAALLVGDGMITPAISVLSAVEGITVPSPGLRPLVVPVTIAILIALFVIQRRGTKRLARFFAPIMTLWFVTIGVLGVVAIVGNPAALAALSPLHGVRFFLANGWLGFVLLGAIVLAVTGGEALYADMGHFGAPAIRRAWLWVVYPALLCCYLGQAAVLLANAAAVERPFFFLVPPAGAYWLVALATPATVIASQSLISGVFSLARQMVQLGYFPRLRIVHTASETIGQVYVPFFNWLLGIACIWLVLAFKRSENLAAAFGLAVSATMTITSILFFAVQRRSLRRSLAASLPLLLLFLAFDLPFLGANLLKLFDGGYLPLLIATALLTIMLIWQRGRFLLARQQQKSAVSIDEFLARVSPHPMREPGIVRAPGAAIVLTASSEGVPPVLLQLVRRVGVLPEQVVLFTFEPREQPTIEDPGRVVVTHLGAGLHRVIARVGFMERPNLFAILAQARAQLPQVDLAAASYFVGHETFVARGTRWRDRWFEALFATISRNARPASAYYRLPPNEVVELGAQIDL